MSLKDDLIELGERIRGMALIDAPEQRLQEALVLTAELRGIAKGLSEAPASMPFGQDDGAGELMKAKARILAQEAAQKARREEADTTSIMMCEGGPFADTTVPVSSAMPEGAYCSVGGQRYQRRGQMLVFAPQVKG